jgi:hypothetical protein
MITKTEKTIWVLSITCLLCVLFYSLVQAEGGKIEIAFKDDRISATIEGGSLRDIAERFKAEKGIRINGKKSLLDEEVSVEFKDLAIVEGLKRIFSKMSYSLIFDQDGKVMEAMLFGKIEGVQKRRPSPPPKRKRPPRRSPRRSPKRVPSGR